MSVYELPTLRPAGVPLLARGMFAALRKIRYGTLLLTTPAGETLRFAGTEPGRRADLRLADWNVAGELLRASDIALGECYRDGRVETSNLLELLLFFIDNAGPLEAVFRGNPLVSLYYRLLHRLRSNSKRQARRNIAAHYDLSNAFYQLWLDRTMTYSAGIGVAHGTLEEAQTAKCERILDLLKPRPGDHILEIGCGWGGFAVHAARTRGVRVTGLTLSPAQLEFARARLAAAGLAHQVDLHLTDYRDIDAQFDSIVSIEMFEAVGEPYWSTYFRQLHRCLKPGGRAVVQTITIDPALFPHYRLSSDFIREYIFPGGMLVPVPHFIAAAEAAGLTAGTPYEFGIDYAETLRCWLQNVDAQRAAIHALGFDEKFLRLWRFYLLYCEAGFRSRRTGVMQIELRRPVQAATAEAV